MQKKIIALAVAGLLSGAAFAQTNVTISGVLDVGLNNAKGTFTGSGFSASNNAGYNNTATSNIAFRAQEDLGGGMKAGMFLESDIRGGATALLGSFQKYVYINGGWGELSFGQRTNFATTTATTAQPFGTAMGGGYSTAFGRLQGFGYGATGALTASGATATLSGNRDVRADGSIRYDSPNMQGFTAGLSYKPKNVGESVVANNTETTPATGHLNLGLNYANGPMKVSYAYVKIDNTNLGRAAVAANPATGLTAITAADGYNGSTKHNLLGANYAFGPATVYAGYTTSKADTTGATAGNEFDSRSWNLGLKYAVAGNIDLLANYLKDNDKTSNNYDRKLIGLGMDYGFSKRTVAYLRYEAADANTNAATGKVTTYSAGLRHAF
ncbi:MAG: porin [Pseudomonadota bacterium]